MAALEDGSSTCSSDAIRGRAICQNQRFCGQAAPSTVAIFFFFLLFYLFIYLFCFFCAIYFQGGVFY